MEIANILDYKESTRFKELKAKMWALASNQEPFEIEEESAAEYRYFHKLYVLYLKVCGKQITKQQAADADAKNYQQFVEAQAEWEKWVFCEIDKKAGEKM